MLLDELKKAQAKMANLEAKRGPLTLPDGYNEADQHLTNVIKAFAKKIDTTQISNDTNRRLIEFAAEHGHLNDSGIQLMLEIEAAQRQPKETNIGDRPAK